MKKYLAAAAIAVVAAMAFAATASADVPRYQFQTATFTVTEPAGAVDQWTDIWTHSYTVTVNPCNNTFTGTGTAQIRTGGATEGTGETITGSFSAYGTASFVAIRTYDNRHWTVTNAPMDGTTEVLAVTTPAISWDIDMKVSSPQFTNTSDWRTHGAYVKSLGGGSDAAHECIGMPIQDVALTFAATTPQGAPDQWTNVWTHTYVIYYHAADHTFTGTGTNIGTIAEGTCAAGSVCNTETISGTLNPSSITFDAHYVTGPYSLSGTPSFDYIWHFNGPFNTETVATSNWQGQTLDVKVTEPVAVP